MSSSNVQRLKSVVVKPPVHPLNRPSHRQQASHDQASQRQASQRSASPVPRSSTPPSETISFGDLVNPDWSKEKRLVNSVQYFGHFFPGEDSDWTQEEVEAECARQQAIVNRGRSPVTERSPAFILHPNFKSPSPPKEPQEESESEEEEEYRLPFEYKPHPTLSIDWDAVRAQPYQRTEDSAAYKAAVLNSTKRKSEEDSEEDPEAIKSKFKALKSKFYFVYFKLNNFNSFLFFL